MAISRNVAHRIDRAARPEHRDTVGARRCAQTKMQTQIALREIAATAADFIDLSQGARLYYNTRADAIPIRSGPCELYTDPVARRRRIRYEQRWIFMQLIHYHG